MQIYNVPVLKAPKKGKLEVVGSGFRYAADSEGLEPDNFTLVVLGKNRHNVGTSILDIAVEHPHKTAASEVPHNPNASSLAAVSPSPQLARRTDAVVLM